MLKIFGKEIRLTATHQHLDFKIISQAAVEIFTSSWLGKFQLDNGILTNSTYMAEFAEGTGSLGTPHTDPNLDGWPDPNKGWPDVNTTRMAKNNMKVSSNGDVCVIATGRRTITTANAYQKMVKPNNGGLSAWNSFVRVYDSQFHVPKYLHW